MKLTRSQLHRLICEMMIKESMNSSQHVDPDEFAKEFFMKESFYRLTYLRNIVNNLRYFLRSVIKESEEWYWSIDSLGDAEDNTMFGKEFQSEFLKPAREYAISLFETLTAIRRLLLNMQHAFNSTISQINKYNACYEYNNLAEIDSNIDFAGFINQYHTSDVVLENPVTYVVRTAKEAKHNILNIEPTDKDNLKFKNNVEVNLERYGIEPLDLGETLKVTAELFTLHPDQKFFENYILDGVTNFERYIQKLLADLESDYPLYIDELVILIKDEFPNKFAKSFPISNESELLEN